MCDAPLVLKLVRNWLNLAHSDFVINRLKFWVVMTFTCLFFFFSNQLFKNTMNITDQVLFFKISLKCYWIQWSCHISLFTSTEKGLASLSHWNYTLKFSSISSYKVWKTSCVLPLPHTEMVWVQSCACTTEILASCRGTWKPLLLALVLLNSQWKEVIMASIHHKTNKAWVWILTM